MSMPSHFLFWSTSGASTPHRAHSRNLHTFAPLQLTNDTNTQDLLTHLSTMGNDGGSIPKRRELVKEAAKALTTTQAKEQLTEQQEYHWSTCPLSRKPLATPVVSDAAGTLYNKDSVIEFLLKEDGREKEEAGKVADVRSEGQFVELGCVGDRVKGLKDVVEVKFEIGAVEAKEGSGRSENWVCPITGRELGPGAKAVYIVPCGHAFAGSVVKEVAGSVCLQVCSVILACSLEVEWRTCANESSAMSRMPRTTLYPSYQLYPPISHA
jgi:hypothetical protein